MKLRSLLIAALMTLGLSAPACAQVPKSTLLTNLTTCFPDQSTGAITPAVLRACLTTYINSWQQFPAVNPQTGTSYAFVANDYGQLVTFSNASAIAVALPQAAGSFLVYNVYATNLGAGTVTITPTTSTINGAATLVLTSGQSAWIVSDGTNYKAINAGFNASNLIAGAGITITGTTTPTIAVTANGISNALFRQGTALSVVGVTGNALANVADIAGAASQFLGVNAAGTALAFSTMSQDCVLSGPVITCTKTNNVAFTSYATATIGQLAGTATNDSATAGKIGEFISSSIVSGSAVSLTTGTRVTITSISLTAGDWDVWINARYAVNAATVVSGFETSISLVNNTQDGTNGRVAFLPFSAFAGQGFTAGDTTLTAGPARLSLSTTTTVFMVSAAFFTTNVASGYGIIQARRVR